MKTPFVDIFGQIMANVRAEYDASELKRPFYLHGHPAEIFGILAEKDQSETFKYDKYPLVVLFEDFKETSDTVKRTASGITVVIMTETSPHYKSANRYDNTFAPILQPIYEMLIKHIIRSKLVGSDNLYLHDHWNRPYYGVSDTFGNSGNIGNDALDAIVIENLNLNILECRQN